MSDLKPCPFCKTKSPVLNEYVPMSGYSYYYVECKNKKCHVNPVTNNFGTKEEAIKAWNTRNISFYPKTEDKDYLYQLVQ